MNVTQEENHIESLLHETDFFPFVFQGEISEGRIQDTRQHTAVCLSGKSPAEERVVLRQVTQHFPR